MPHQYKLVEDARTGVRGIIKRDTVKRFPIDASLAKHLITEVRVAATRLPCRVYGAPGACFFIQQPHAVAFVFCPDTLAMPPP